PDVEKGEAVGQESASLAGIAPGTYQFRVFCGTPPTRQGTGTFTIYASASGHYELVAVPEPVYKPVIIGYAPVIETRQGTRTVAVAEWVPDGSSVDYDENGVPVEGYGGHYETRYRTETYTYNAVVDQRPS